MLNNYELFKRIRKDQDLLPGEKLVMLILASYRNNHTGKCCPGQRTLATDTGYSQRTVGRYLQALQDKRKITANKAERRRSDYILYPNLTHPDASPSDAPLGAAEQHTTTRKSKTRNNRKGSWKDYKEQCKFLATHGPSGERLDMELERMKLAREMGLLH